MSIFTNAMSIGATNEVRAEKQAMKQEYQAQQVDVSFREEVIAELVASGFAPHVAANMTDNQAKLMAKAREIGYI